jgi:hypothetical protein
MATLVRTKEETVTANSTRQSNNPFLENGVPKPFPRELLGQQAEEARDGRTRELVGLREEEEMTVKVEVEEPVEDEAGPSSVGAAGLEDEEIVVATVSPTYIPWHA